MALALPPCLKFTDEATGRFDWGLAGFSSLYAAKSGTSAHEPFTRRVLFGFGGWREPEMASCGGWYVLPRELTLSPEGTLLQHPAVEMKKLRKGAAISGPDQLAAGGQIEVLVRCPLPAPRSDHHPFSSDSMRAGITSPHFATG